MDQETRQMRLTASGACEVQLRIEKLKEKLVNYDEALIRAVQKFGVHDDQYFERLQRKMYCEEELATLERMLASSKIINQGEESNNTVNLGNKVKLTNHKICYMFQIVTPLEANPITGKISAESPIGSTIIGKKMGSIVHVSLPKGEIELKIEAIE